ncbi:hypothetical protein Tco_1484130 [Tanacetum coccineum]
MMVVKEIENELLEEVELEWWFEQDIDDEGEEDEEDGGGDEGNGLSKEKRPKWKPKWTTRRRARELDAIM